MSTEIEQAQRQTTLPWWRKCCTAQHWLQLRHLPDACTNAEHEAWVLQQRRSNTTATTTDERPEWQRLLARDRNLLIVVVVMVICLNFRWGRLLLYPFRLFSTWIHEMCHGLGAILTGGRIARLEIFHDGSGLAYTATKSSFGRAFTSSGGYPGTAVTGFLLLMFRRTTLGPTFGTLGLGLAIVISVLLWVRNAFGIVILGLEGLVLILLGWKLPAVAVDNLFNLLAATCCLNAFENIRNLFSAGTFVVGGEEVFSSDAHTVADHWGGNFRVWATMWLLLSLFLTGLGIWLSRDGRPIPAWLKKYSNGAGVAGSAVTATNVAVAPTATPTSTVRPTGPDLTV